MFPALLESSCQGWDYFFVIIQKLAQDIAKPVLVGFCENLRKLVEYVKGSDVKLVDAQDGGIATDNEGEVAKARDPVGDANGQFFDKVLRAAHDMVPIFGIHDGGWSQPHRVLQKKTCLNV